MDAIRLGLEAQGVIGLRMMKAAFGGPAAHREVHLMIAEKAKAAVETQMMVINSVMRGEADFAPARAIALYRRHVQANQKRLSQGR